MKRSTAIRHLVEMAEVSSEQLRHRDTFAWPLEELWVTGVLLGLGDTLDRGSVVLHLDLPPEDIPWLAKHPMGESIGYQLRLGKRPMSWAYRPLAWPVWNHEHRRLLRFWSADGGLDASVIEALRARRVDALAIVEPREDDLIEQLRVELEVSRRYLREMLDHYWDREWRRDHKGYDESPEDHLWRAATAVSEITDALDEITG